MKKRERQSQDFSLTFLDVISCGFGAIVMLVILAKEPMLSLMQEKNQLDKTPASVEEFSKETVELKVKINKLEQKYAASKKRLEKIRSNNIIKRNYLNSRQTNSNKVEERMAKTIRSTFVGGIPVDREHVIFIVDTSGSMKRYWSLVIQQIDVILELHPKIKGFQVMSDNGEYLLEGYAASWIPDTNLVRKRIVKKLRSWSPYSNSSPAEGLERALRFHTKKPVSIYVMGDDFTGASYDDILNKVKRMNPRQSNGEKIAKIHGIGFPWGLDERFPTLMRELAFQNDGVFLNAKIPIQNASL